MQRCAALTCAQRNQLQRKRPRNAMPRGSVRRNFVLRIWGNKRVPFPVARLSRPPNGVCRRRAPPAKRKVFDGGGRHCQNG